MPIYLLGFIMIEKPIRAIDMYVPKAPVTPKSKIVPYLSADYKTVYGDRTLPVTRLAPIELRGANLPWGAS